MRECDVLVIGAGPGGLAAGYAAKKSGAENVIILERDESPGGILNQCIHNGFGLIRYKHELSGPEYAAKALSESVDSGVEIYCSRHVNKIEKTDMSEYIVYAYTKGGLEKYFARSIILATGCRERTRGNISIPGSRPAGVFTAGVAQNLVNCRNVMPGKRVVILGSGDIGLIMARRLTLEGAKVLAIAEIMSEPTGLARNVSQCVYDFDIPLYVRTTVSRIIGKKRLEAVELSELDKTGRIIHGTEKRIECDTLILSVGLIPENEVAQTIGVRLLDNNAVETDCFLQTNIPGVFSCGNSRHVMDLADYVSEQGEMAGRNAVHYILNEEMESWDEEKTNCMKKGFPEGNTITCTVCPNGCQVKYDEVSGSYSGNKCPRGIDFATQERLSPRRMVTTTVKTKRNAKLLLPVRTEEPIPREEVFNVVKKMQNIVVDSSVKIGDVINEYDIKGKNINIVASATLE